MYVLVSSSTIYIFVQTNFSFGPVTYLPFALYPPAPERKAEAFLPLGLTARLCQEQEG